MQQIIYVAFAIIFLITSCTVKYKPGNNSTLTIVSKNESLDVSNVKISVLIMSDDSNESTNPKIIVWDGKKENQIPDYGVLGATWFINYKDSVYGEFVHSKVITNNPLEYKFLINRNNDGSVFFQYDIPQSGSDSKDRIKLQQPSD